MIYPNNAGEKLGFFDIKEFDFDHYIKQVYIETLQRKRREELIKPHKFVW